MTHTIEVTCPCRAEMFETETETPACTRCLSDHVQAPHPAAICLAHYQILEEALSAVLHEEDEPHVNALIHRGGAWLSRMFDKQVLGATLTTMEAEAIDIIRDLLVYVPTSPTRIQRKRTTPQKGEQP